MADLLGAGWSDFAMKLVNQESRDRQTAATAQSDALKQLSALSTANKPTTPRWVWPTVIGAGLIGVVGLVAWSRR